MSSARRQTKGLGTGHLRDSARRPDSCCDQQRRRVIGPGPRSAIWQQPVVVRFLCSHNCVRTTCVTVYFGQWASRPELRAQLLTVPLQRSHSNHSGSARVSADGILYIALGDNTSPFESDGYAPIDERPGRSDWDARKSRRRIPTTCAVRSCRTAATQWHVHDSCGQSLPGRRIPGSAGDLCDG